MKKNNASFFKDAPKVKPNKSFFKEYKVSSKTQLLDFLLNNLTSKSRNNIKQ